MFSLIPELRQAPQPRRDPDCSRIYDHALPMLRRCRGWPGGLARAALMVRDYTPDPDHRMWSQVKEWSVTGPTPLENLTVSMADGGVALSSDPITWAGTFSAGWMVIMVEFLDGDDTPLLCASDLGGSLSVVAGGTFTVTPDPSGWMVV